MGDLARLHYFAALLFAGSLAVMLWKDAHQAPDRAHYTSSQLLLVLPEQSDTQSGTQSGEHDPDSDDDDGTGDPGEDDPIAI